MLHTYKNNGSQKTLVLFHGTGGDENSLISLAQHIAPHMNHLALRGDVVSHGKRRFAKVSHEDEILDVEDMLHRARGIRQILNALKVRYQIDEMWALGFSNGANAIIALLLNEAPIFKKAVLLRPMNLDIETNEIPLNNMDILIHSGTKDHIIPPKFAFEAEARLSRNGANVEHVSCDLDHRMRAQEIDMLKIWFEKALKES